MKCDECKIDYPNELVNQMRSSKGNFNVCGICALELSNQIHGIKRTKFDGEMAENLRQQAIKFRKEHNL